MDHLFKEIRRVQRRLALQQFLGKLGWCWFAALLIAVMVIATARFFPLGIVDWQWLAGLLAAGFAAAVGWTLLSMTSDIQAALEIDHRFGLKERVSSTLAMNAADRETQAGQTVIADADARLKRIAVLDKFPVRPSRNLLLPLLPALVIAAVMALRPPLRNLASEDVETAVGPPPLEVRQSADDLRQKLSERRKLAEKEGLKDASELLKQLEEGAKELQTQAQRDKALVKLNDLARELQERRKQLGGGNEALKRQMEKIDDITHGPADELAKALAKSDFQKASRALEKLEKKLSENQLDSAKKEELAKQIEQLKQKIDQMAQQAKEAQADLTKRAKQAGNAGAAEKLQDEIQKMQQQNPQMQSLQDLANKLGQCSQQMQQGKNAEAAQTLDEALKEMQALAQQQSELKTLDGAMQQLADARKQMNCDQCGGKGCDKCQGGAEANKVATEGEGGPKNGSPGQGIGHGRGDGGRPDETAKGTFFDSRVPQTVGKGAGQISGLTGGANLKVQAEEEIQKSTAEIEHGNADPLSGQRLPKKQSEHARQYFDSFREGK